MLPKRPPAASAEPPSALFAPYRPDPYEVPPELLALLTGKPKAASAKPDDVVSLLVAGLKWEFRGSRLLKVYEDETAMAWLDPEGWTDCVVLLASKAVPGLAAAVPDAMPLGSLAGAGTALQHVSRGVRLGAAELWGYPPEEIGLSVTLSCGAAAGGVFQRPVFVICPRRTADSHFRNAASALAMGSGKGDVRAVRRRLADPAPALRLPAALPSAQAAAVILFNSTARVNGRARVRIMQFDAAGKIRCMDSRCPSAAGPRSRPPVDGPAMSGARHSGSITGSAATQEWELVLTDTDGSRELAAADASARSRMQAAAAIASITEGMTAAQAAGEMARFGVARADVEELRGLQKAGAGVTGSTSLAAATKAASPALRLAASVGMGPVSCWPSATAAPLFVSLRNPKAALSLVAEGSKHGFVMAGAGVRLGRPDQQGGLARALQFQVVPVNSDAPHLAGGVHFRVPFLVQGEPGGGTLLESQLGAPGSQTPHLRLAACQGAGVVGDDATPELLIGADEAGLYSATASQKWLYLTVEALPPPDLSGKAPSLLTLEPLMQSPRSREAGNSVGPVRAVSAAPGAALKRQTFFLAPFWHAMNPAVIPASFGTAAAGASM